MLRFPPISIGCCFLVFHTILFNQVRANCSSDSQAKTCKHGSQTCPACIQISWLTRPPFAIEKGDTAEGVLPGILCNFYCCHFYCEYWSKHVPCRFCLLMPLPISCKTIFYRRAEGSCGREKWVYLTSNPWSNLRSRFYHFKKSKSKSKCNRG